MEYLNKVALRSMHPYQENGGILGFDNRGSFVFATNLDTSKVRGIRSNVVPMFIIRSHPQASKKR